MLASMDSCADRAKLLEENKVGNIEVVLFPLGRDYPGSSGASTSSIAVRPSTAFQLQRKGIVIPLLRHN